MYDYYNSTGISDGNSGNSNLTQTVSYPELQYQAYQEAYKMIGHLFGSIAKIFTK